MKKLYLLTFFFLGLTTQAQLIIDNTTQTPKQLVENVLVGNGVTPFNVKFNGSAANATVVRDQVAKFSTNFNPTNLGLNTGLLLTTGQAQVANGPNNSAGLSIVSTTPTAGDIDLARTINPVTPDPTEIENSAILEFDFVATGPTLHFDFAFASEEYPEYVNSGFNDVFGFFLSGPGILGPFTNNAANIALVPSTTTPVSINNVNNGHNNNGTCANCAYYYNNTNIGVNPTTWNPLFTTQYDGFTKNLSANAQLECGQTYHIKLAIGNVSDNAFDSAVFLKDFAIPPMVLMDVSGADTIIGCQGDTVINSGIPAGTNVFVWTLDGVVIPGETGPSIIVSENGVYQLTVYTALGCMIAQDDILVDFALVDTLDPLDIVICEAAAPMHIFNIDQTAYMLDFANTGYTTPGDFVFSYHVDNAGAPGAVIPNGSLGAYSSPGLGETIWVVVEDININGCTKQVPFTLTSMTAPSGTFSYPDSPYCSDDNTAHLPVLSGLTSGGTYSYAVTPPGPGTLDLNTTTGAITPGLSTFNTTYTVSYDVPLSGSCPAYHTETTVTINFCVTCTTVASNSGPICAGDTFDLFATNAGAGATYSWTGPNGFVSTDQNPVGVSTPTGTAPYVYTVTATIGGIPCSTNSTTLTVNPIPAAPTVTVPAPYCQNATASALTATGTGLLWYTVATGGTGSATAPIPSTATVGTITYYVSQTVSGCESPRASIAVTVNSIPAAPTVTVPPPYCQNTTASALTATGTGLLWYTTATGGTGSTTAPIPSTATAGTTTYYVSQTVSGCESPRASIAVVVTATPSAPTVTTPVTYCQSDTASALTATGTGLLWYTVATGGTGSATAPIPSTATAGTTTYYVSQTVSGCESPRASIAVTVNGTPAAPTVTVPAPYCQNATASALTATGTGLLWYTTATGGTGSATAPIPSTATVGTITYYVSQTILTCEGPRASIAVTVTAIPAAPTVTVPPPYCQNTTASALTATGTGLLWYTTATGGTGSATAPIPSTATAGTTTYYVSQTVSGCESPRASIAVVVTATPPAPTVTTPVTYCQSDTASALTATGAGLLWYTVATGGTGSATAPIPSTATAGTTTYYVSQTVSGCESPRASIAVTVNGTPAAPTVTVPAPYCQNATASALTATGTGLLWYTVATGGTGSATAPIPSTATVGTITYYVSQTILTCEGPRASIAVTVTAIPAAPTVTVPPPYCQNTTASALTATGTGLLWYTTATGGTGSATAPIPSTATAGTTTYYVSQTVSGCESPRASIAVVVTATPPAPTVTTPVTYCQSDTASALTATGTGLLWYTVATGGTGSATAPIPSTATAGTTTYYVSQTVSGCESPRASIAVTVNGTPAAPTVTVPAPYCQNATASALTATGTGLLWYTVATGGTGSATAPIPSTAAVGTITYYVSQTILTCEGPRASIAVTVTATPAAPTVTVPPPYCQNTTASALTATGTSLLWYTTATGGVGSTIAPIPGTSAAGTTTYYVSQTTSGCESPRSSIAVIVNGLPNPVLTDGYICIDSQTGLPITTFELNANLDDVNYDFEWYNTTTIPAVLIAGATQNTYEATTPGTYEVIAIDLTTNCRSNMGDAQATVGTSSAPESIVVVPSNYFAEVQTITVNAIPAGNYEYQIDNGGFQSSNVFTNVGAGSHNIEVRDVNQCGLLLGQTFIVDYPHFFTPNGDGYHDTWNISALSNQSNAKIYIFDRFGKLLKEIRPSNDGWNGTFNGIDLPSTDYWFIVYYEENQVSKEFKAHFALKR